MLYRPFGKTGEMVSILGFGCMRLPVIDGRRECIDDRQATSMLRYAIDHGVNYVDTAYPYHGSGHGKPGASEGFVGRALSDGYRERVLLATKLPSWMVQQRGDMDRLLEGQLERLQTDHIDCYLLHALNAGWWKNLDTLGVLEFLETARSDGRIRYAGFSFHDDGESFAPIVDAADWDFCQIQYNYMDAEYQAGEAGLRHAADRGLGVVVMEPLKGGWLAARVPAEARSVWDRAPVARTPAEWALRFVWNDPGVSLLLSGMNTLEQVVENVAATEGALPGTLSDEELALVGEVRDVYRSRIRAECTACGYCLPCPAGVDIPGVIGHLNNAALYDDVFGAKELYEMGSRGRASLCTGCEQCLELCPQQLPIPDLMDEAAALFGS